MVSGGRLAGRHALVTGAAGGIGSAVIGAYLAADAACTAVDMGPSPSAAISELQNRFPGRLTYRQADVSEVDLLPQLVESAASDMGPINILFNNAAVFDLAPLLESNLAMYNTLYDVNVKGMFFMMQAALAHMVATGSSIGSVINLASQAGRRGEALVSHYCATKAAVISYTQSAALAMAPHGIRVNAIAPGVIETPMWDRVDALFARHEGLKPGEKKRAVGLAVPLGRMGNPDDICGAAVFLASEESQYITAQTLNVDGGSVMS